MPDLSSTLRISVANTGADGSNQVVTDAEVALVKSDNVLDVWPYSGLEVTHKYETTTGGYTEYVGPDDAQPGPGEWFLVVRKAPFTPVVQRLTLSTFKWTDKDGQHEALRAAPGWASKHESGRRACAISVEITNAGVASKAMPVPQITTVKTLLLPRTDFIGFACHNHLGQGTDYRIFAETRLAVLYMRGTGKNSKDAKGAKLGKGMVGTIFHADKRTTRVLLKSADPTASSWVTVYEEVKFPLDSDAGHSRPTPEHELGIIDFYMKLDSLGLESPGTCVEAGIFGHSWVNGPILWGTYEDTNSTTSRASGDLDGRTKDWLADGVQAMTATGNASEGPTTRTFPNMAKAFVSGQDFTGRLRVWGCSHMRRTRSELNSAWNQLALVNKGTSNRSSVFVFELKDFRTDEIGQPWMIGWESATLDHVKMNIHGYASSRYFGRTQEDGDARGMVNYIGAAAQYLAASGVLVFGAPPGMGSLYRGVGGTGIKDAAAFFIKVDADENFVGHQYLKREFGSYYEEDEAGLAYLNYSQFLKLPATELTDPGWNTQRSMAFFDDDQGVAVLRLPSETEVHLPPKDPSKPPEKQPNDFPSKAFLHPTPYNNDGHLYVMPKSVPDRVEARGPRQVLVLKVDDTTDSAVWVQTTGKLVLMTRPHGTGPFLPQTSAIAKATASYTNQSNWQAQIPANLPPITDGVLENVTPRYYW